MGYYKGYAVNLNKKDDPNWSKPQPVRAVLVYKDESGKRRQITRVLEGKHRKKAAERLVESWQEEMEKLHAQEEAARVAEEAELAIRAEHPDAWLTVSEYARSYVQGLDGVEASTIAGYMRICTKLGAAFGDIAIRDLRRANVERWRDHMKNEGLSAYTIRKYLRFLNAICSHAVSEDDIDRNPCTNVRSPKVAKKIVTTLEMGEVARLCGILRNLEPTPVVTAASIALFAGLRAGEACGLRWCDVDFDAPAITVNHAIGVGKGGTYLKSTKTDKPRIVQMVPQLREALQRRRDVMRRDWKELRLSLGVPATDKDFGELFVIGDKTGKPAHPQLLSHQWATFADNYGIRDNTGSRSTFHNLRHTFASILIADGWEDVQVAQLMGHARPSMTKDVYAAAFEERGKEAIATLGKSIGETFASLREADVVKLDSAASE